MSFSFPSSLASGTMAATHFSGRSKNKNKFRQHLQLEKAPLPKTVDVAQALPWIEKLQAKVDPKGQLIQRVAKQDQNVFAQARALLYSEVHGWDMKPQLDGFISLNLKKGHFKQLSAPVIGGKMQLSDLKHIARFFTAVHDSAFKPMDDQQAAIHRRAGILDSTPSARRNDRHESDALFLTDLPRTRPLNDEDNPFAIHRNALRPEAINLVEEITPAYIEAKLKALQQDDPDYIEKVKLRLQESKRPPLALPFSLKDKLKELIRIDED